MSSPSPCGEFTARPGDPSPSIRPADVQPPHASRSAAGPRSRSAEPADVLTSLFRAVAASSTSPPPIIGRGAAMTANLPLMSGGQLVVAALRAHGVRMAFSVAGESYLEVLDALFDAPEIRLITCRQEGGAAFMAEAYGKLTGEPGVLLVTRGPGACNASIGVHTAFQDSTPMVVLVGQVARHQIDREAFQEVDFRQMFAPLAKWVAQIDMADRVPELINQAFQVATSGRPGPVVLALPEDMLRDRREAAAVGPYRAVHAHPGAADLAELRRLLAAA